MGEAVADEAELALLGILLDGVEEIILGDLFVQLVHGGVSIGLIGCAPYLLLSVGPAGDLNDHVQDGLLLVGIQGNVVEG